MQNSFIHSFSSSKISLPKYNLKFFNSGIYEACSKVKLSHYIHLSAFKLNLILFINLFLLNLLYLAVDLFPNWLCQMLIHTCWLCVLRNYYSMQCKCERDENQLEHVRSTSAVWEMELSTNCFKYWKLIADAIQRALAHFSFSAGHQLLYDDASSKLIAMNWDSLEWYEW